MAGLLKDPYQMNGGLTAHEIAAIDSGGALTNTGGVASKVASNTPGLSSSNVGWGDAALTGLAIALGTLGGGNSRDTSTSHSSSTLGPAATSSWSPATESLIKMLDSMQSSWTKYGKA